MVIMKLHPSKYKATNFLLIIALLSLFSCSKEKDTFSARLYHNTTSYFNGYYNADYLYKETIDRLEEQYDYPELGFIEVVYYGTEDEIKNYVTDFENIIKKNDAVMFKHPNGNWIDDCRLLNGKSWFYRQNYSLAMENFDYVLKTFPESDKLGETHFFIAQTHYQMENYQMSRDVLDELLRNDTLSLDADILGEVALFKTKLEIEEKNYKQAAKTLSEYMENIKGRRRQARSHFLLGQLYAENKDFPHAFEQFTLVKKYSDDYDLTFTSKMKIARLYVDFQEGQDDDQEVYKYLQQLLKDEKNEEYQDQIYYEFALLELKKENREAAVDYLKLSIATNVSNQRQKALSYYKIGQIHFYDLQDYPVAQAYYDSAASVINEDAPEYKEITTLAATLKDYITYINTIHFQDSMLYLAALPEAERDSIVKAIADEAERKKKEEAEQLLAEMEKQSNNSFYNPLLQNQAGQQRNGRNNSSGGQWYFDNPSTISNGKIQFEQVWGKRANQDDWRRSKKTATFASQVDNSDEEAEAEPVDSTLLVKYGDKYSYYKDIPKTEEEIAEAHIKIEEAIYKLGQLYAQKLNEPDSAIKTYEDLLDRYEDSEYTLRARYALYNLYREKKNPIANIHKNFILTEYPQTVYAYLIQNKDPKELKKDEADFKFAYDGLFNAYRNQQYETSLGFSEFLLAQAKFGENQELDLAQLQYIRGMSYGFTGEKDSLRNILTRVVKDFPEAEVTPIAKKTLAFMDKGDGGLSGSATDKKTPKGETLTIASPEGDLANPENPLYRGFNEKVKPSDKIFVLMYVDKNKISKVEANSKVSDFNKKLYASQKLKVFTFLYKNTHLLPYISNFKTIEEASKYIGDFLADESSKAVINTAEEKIFYITHSNFKVAYGQKRMVDYIKYYENILSK